MLEILPLSGEIDNSTEDSEKWYCLTPIWVIMQSQILKLFHCYNCIYYDHFIYIPAQKVSAKPNTTLLLQLQFYAQFHKRSTPLNPSAFGVTLDSSVKK